MVLVTKGTQKYWLSIFLFAAVVWLSKTKANHGAEPGMYLHYLGQADSTHSNGLGHSSALPQHKFQFHTQPPLPRVCSCSNNEFVPAVSGATHVSFPRYLISQ